MEAFKMTKMKRTISVASIFSVFIVFLLFSGVFAATVGEWKFDGNGNNENGDGPDATLQGSTGEAIFKTSGGISNGYAYIQTSGASVQIPYSSLYDLPDTFTIEFWFRQRTEQTFSQDLLVKGSSLYNFYIFRRAWDDVGTDDGSIIAGFNESGDGVWIQVSNSNNPDLNIWHYVAFTKSTTELAYYIDGNLINSSTTSDTAIIQANEPINIGTTAVDTDIDELRISDVSKSVSDISTYYNSFSPEANAGSDQNIFEGSSVTLDGTASSIPTGTTVTYQWTQTAGTTVTISNPTSASASFTAPNVGTGGESLTFQLTVTNNGAQVSSDTCLVNVGDVPGPGTYYVNTSTGSDNNDGSATSPWETIHGAISKINAGASGTYVLHVALGDAPYKYNISTGEADSQLVLSQSNVTIIGESGSAPIIDGASASLWTKGIDITGANVTIENLYVTGFSGTDEVGIWISSENEEQQLTVLRKCKLYENNWGIHIDSAIGVKIQDCEIYQNTTHGIDVTWSSNVVVTGNKVYSNPQYGIRAQCSPEISRNLIYDNATGIRVEAVLDNDVSSPTIKNNVIYKTTSGAMSYGIYTKAVYNESSGTTTASPVIYHNTIDGGTLTGIAMEKGVNGVSSPTIKYNIITNFRNEDENGIGIKKTGAIPTVEYNDVWNNDTDYSGWEVDPSPNISSDPKYGSYTLQSNSPCINAIDEDEAANDPVTLDYPGFTRPRPGKRTKDMGAYEYVADVTNNYTLPGGTGVATDYRIFTVPLNLGTGADMLTAMENVLGTYDPVHWRGFLYSGTSYREFNSDEFADATIKPGMGFWIITTYTSQIPFQGGPAPDGVDYVMTLDPGWHLIGLPWTDTQISLGNMTVTDGVNSYSITGQPDNARLTQEWVWDYTGSYVKKTGLLSVNTGYFFKVEAASSIRLTIPLNNNQGLDAPVDVPPNQTNTNEDDEAPPPPPGSEPIPDIKANGEDGPVTVSAGDPVSVSVSLDPGAWSGRNADWWVAAHTPFDPPLDWYTYVYPDGWRYGIYVCTQTPLYDLTPSFNVLNTVLPAGNYIFYFAVDGNMDGVTDATWLDYVEVNVE
jgi:hypothetical protein